MNYLEKRLQPLVNPDSSMWIDEAIWGHMLYDEQGPWLIYLEFLNVFYDQANKGCAFQEPDGYNTLKYWAAWRLELRNILFNNPKLRAIQEAPLGDKRRWQDWHKAMQFSGGIDLPNFTYLENHFHSFDDFAYVVEILRGSGIETETNKRWTSKYVFPYGENCIYEDLDPKARTNDRHFFRRTGELLYLIFSRAEKKDELLQLITTHLLNKEDADFDQIVKILQPETSTPKGAERAKAFLPYPSHPSYDALTEDWISVLKLGLPGYDSLPHLVNLAAFHILLYQLRVSKDISNPSQPLRLVCEIIAPKKTLVREISCSLYEENNLLPARAVSSYIDVIEHSDEWQDALNQPGKFVRCKNILEKTVLWGDGYEGATDPESLIMDLRASALKRHKQHVANIHRNYGREVGLVSRRGTVKLRYAPNDALLKSLIFASVEKRMELQQFLKLLWERYSIVIGDKEAEKLLPTGDFDKKAFQANARRLEQRLSSLGLLKRLSDGCAYVLNPYSRSDQ